MPLLPAAQASDATCVPWPISSIVGGPCPGRRRSRRGRRCLPASSGWVAVDAGVDDRDGARPSPCVMSQARGQVLARGPPLTTVPGGVPTAVSGASAPGRWARSAARSGARPATDATRGSARRRAASARECLARRRADGDQARAAGRDGRRGVRRRAPRRAGGRRGVAAPAWRLVERDEQRGRSRGRAGARGRRAQREQRRSRERPATRRQALARAQYPRANFASSLIRSGVHGGVKIISTSTVSTPSSSPTNSSICSVTCGPIGHAGRGQRERHVDVAAVDLDAVDQAELDEVEPELGVDHVGERVLDVFDGGHARV